MQNALHPLRQMKKTQAGVEDCEEVTGCSSPTVGLNQRVGSWVVCESEQERRRSRRSRRQRRRDFHLERIFSGKRVSERIFHVLPIVCQNLTAWKEENIFRCIALLHLSSKMHYFTEYVHWKVRT